jgi:two-component system LytT family response regulator
MNVVELNESYTHVNILGGARVVIIEPDAAVREGIRSAVDSARTFVVAGVAESWRAGLELVETFVPELVIIRDSELSAGAFAVAEGAFPLLIQIGIRASSPRANSPLEVLSLPIDSMALGRALDRARSEICSRKAAELSDLLALYLNASNNLPHYLSSLKVEDSSQTIELAMEEITSISADGNYVCVHTPRKTYELRETMTGLSSRLDPRMFIRVHRSFIVNLRHVNGVMDKSGGASVVVLNDGTELPVGPNYRDEVMAAVGRKARLSA